MGYEDYVEGAKKVVTAIACEAHRPVDTKKECPWCRAEKAEMESRQKRGLCLWHGDETSWVTKCDERHEFTEDGPIENRHKFCPYCGRYILVVGEPWTD